MNVPGQGGKACSYGCMIRSICKELVSLDSIHIVDLQQIGDGREMHMCGKC